MNFAMNLTGKVKTRPMISCSECGREFQRNRKADLQRHMRIHTNEKPFVCPYPQCGRAFRQSSALKNHSNYHVRDTAFTCAQCELNFFDKPTFNRHVREKHDLEYVFACSVPGCGKHFKRKPVFKAHMQDKHGVSYGDHEALNHRVSAGPYLKATTSSKSAFHSDVSTLPKLSDALQGVHTPQTPSVQLNGSGLYSSNPAVYGGSNAAPVLLTDPYANMSNKLAPPSYVETMSNYAQAPSEYGTSYSAVMPTDLWFPGNDAVYYDGQILGPDQFAACMPIGAPTISFSHAPSPPQGSPNPSFVLSSGTSSGNSGGGSPGSYSPHSRSSTISPISPNTSPTSSQPQFTLRPISYY